MTQHSQSSTMLFSSEELKRENLKELLQEVSKTLQENINNEAKRSNDRFKYFLLTKTERKRKSTIYKELKVRYGEYI